jgi:peptidoglycan/xylan/chitin deacetylase (PgdA/CDA1 family)
LSDVLVLCYHAVSKRWPAAMAIAPEHLEQHLTLLAEWGYRGATFQEAVCEVRTEKTAVITFDDAYRSVIELALPVLSRVGFCATVFAPTAFIGSNEPMAWPGIDPWLDTEHRDELVPMSWEELDSLAREGWEIGSHTSSHPHLPLLDQSVLDRELSESRREIEDRLGRPCHSLAYPYGDHDRRVLDAAGRAGYSAAACTARGGLRPPTGPLDWPRTVVNRFDVDRRARLKLSPTLRRIRATPPFRLLVVARRRLRTGRGASIDASQADVS